MLQIQTKTKFDRDVERLHRQGKDIQKLKHEFKLINQEKSDDLSEDLQKIFDDIDAGRNLSKVYTYLDEMWRDLTDATDPKKH